MSDMCNSTDAIASKNTKYQRNIVCYLTKKGIFTSQFIHNTKWKPHVVRNHEGHHYKAYDSIFKESLDYFDHLLSFIFGLMHKTGAGNDKDKGLGSRAII